MRTDFVHLFYTAMLTALFCPFLYSLVFIQATVFCGRALERYIEEVLV